MTHIESRYIKQKKLKELRHLFELKTRKSTAFDISLYEYEHKHES